MYIGKDPKGPGVLALFCPACPQPGLNLLPEWKSDPDYAAYTRSFVMDGNFSAVHQKRLNAKPEEPLTKGEFFLVEDVRYQCHIKLAKEIKEVRKFTQDTFSCIDRSSFKPATCNEHHAITDKFIKYKGLDVTGIGATACARHGTFCPSGVVDFQKGERSVFIFT